MQKYFKTTACIIVLTIGTAWFFWYDYAHRPDIPEGWFVQSSIITGVVVTDPNRGIDATKIILRPDPRFGVKQKILVTLPGSIDVAYGDRICIEGIVKRPESFTTETNRIFDYPRYLSVKNIGATFRGYSVEVISRNHGSLLLRGIIKLRTQLLDTLKKIYTRNQAGLLAGILLGEQSLLPKEIIATFQQAGLTHIMVLSGHNITLVAQAVIMVSAYLGMGYRMRRVGALVVIPVFLLMTGLGSSSVRAGIMAMIMIGLQMNTRPAHALRIIMAMIGVLWFINPRIILYDPSFHLSLLAFIGLVYAVPWVNSWFAEDSLVITSFFGKLILETTTVQIVVLPYILWMSGQVSLLVLIANLLVVPVISFIMGIGFGSAIVGIVLFPLTVTLSWVTGLLLNYVLWVADRVGSVGSAVVTISPFSGWVVILAYIGIVWALIVATRHIQTRRDIL